MRKKIARLIATFLWRKQRHVFLYSFIIFFGTFVLVHPAHAFFSSDDIAGFIAGIGNFFSSLLAALIIIVIEYMMPVMLYNSFSNAPVVTNGWALVRDTVNMFFVVILIIIAFGTIFGHQKFQWQQQVPKLLFFAVVINFSKTLCGIMIDFGQVIMLTFANALREIAAGNIVELFGLNKFSQFSSSYTGEKIDAWDLALASMASVFILSWVFVIILFELVILLYRIVGLWILIVLAPLAWFIGGTGTLLQSDAYSKWWTRFKCLVAIGPIITFFLWLALAVAGAGNSTQGFGEEAPTEASLGNAPNFLTKIFEMEHFMSLIIGSAMLLAGMEAAQNFCGSVPGIGGLIGKAKTLVPGFAAGLAKKGASVTTALAVKGAAKSLRLGGRGIVGGARMAGRSLAPYVESEKRSKWHPMRYGKVFTKRGRAGLYERAAKGLGQGWIARRLAPKLEENAAELNRARSQEIAKVGEKNKGKSTSVKVNQMERYAQAGKVFKGGEYDALALFGEMLGNPDLKKEFLKSGQKDAFWKKFGASIKSNYKGDEDMEKKIEAFEAENLHLTKLDDPDKAKVKKDLVRRIKKMKPEEISAIGNDAMMDQDVRDALEEADIDVNVKGKMETMKAAVAIRDNHFGREKRELLTSGAENLSDEQLRAMDTDLVTSSATSDVAEHALNQAVTDKDTQRINKIITDLANNYNNATDDSKRFHFASRLQNAMKRMEKRRGEEDDPVLQANVDQIIASLRPHVAGMRNFGKVPPIGASRDPQQFIQDNYTGASKERINHGKQAIAAEKTQVEDARRTEEQKITTALNGQAFREVKGLLDVATSEAEKKLQQAKDKAAAKVTAAQDGLNFIDQEIERVEQEMDRAIRNNDLTASANLRAELGQKRTEKKNKQREFDQAKDEQSKDKDVAKFGRELQAAKQKFLAGVGEDRNISAAQKISFKGLYEKWADYDKQLSNIDVVLNEFERLTPQAPPIPPPPPGPAPGPTQ